MSFVKEVKEELIKLKMWYVNSNIEQEEQIAKLHIRECFLKNGFINNPNKDYHLELLFKTKNQADETLKILENFSINSKITQKNEKYMLYIKEAEEISKFLAFIGANIAVLKFEEIRVEKDARNSINRIVNCETANLSKTINSALIQIQNIKFLKEKGVFSKLPNNLKEIAEIRINNPDESLEELGKKLEKPIGKSGVNHRLKKIEQIANEYKGENKQ